MDQKDAPEKKPPAFPGVEKFVFDTPLYETFTAQDRDGSGGLLHGELKIEGYCRFCQTHRVFRKSDKLSVPGDKISLAHCLSGGFYQFEFECTKSENHKITVLVYLREKEFGKVGQFPSLADTANDAAKLYSKVLEAEDRKELSRAVGLAAHGVGIGSFVYMRRVFERLIERRHAESGLSIENFARLRMGEKIDVLKDHLPIFLVEHKSVYGILSLGIHQLTENECLTFYQVLHESIITILEDDRRKKEDDDRRKSLSDAIRKIQAINRSDVD
jgi:hypothetical protein